MVVQAAKTPRLRPFPHKTPRREVFEAQEGKRYVVIAFVVPCRLYVRFRAILMLSPGCTLAVCSFRAKSPVWNPEEFLQGRLWGCVWISRVFGGGAMQVLPLTVSALPFLQPTSGCCRGNYHPFATGSLLRRRKSIVRDIWPGQLVFRCYERANLLRRSPELHPFSPGSSSCALFWIAGRTTAYPFDAKPLTMPSLFTPKLDEAHAKKTPE